MLNQSADLRSAHGSVKDARMFAKSGGQPVAMIGGRPRRSIAYVIMSNAARANTITDGQDAIARTSLLSYELFQHQADSSADSAPDCSLLGGLRGASRSGFAGGARRQRHPHTRPRAFANAAKRLSHEIL